MLKKRLVRRFFMLALLLAGLGVVSSMPAARASAAYSICCSACETDPPPLPCHHGCDPSC